MAACSTSRCFDLKRGKRRRPLGSRPTDDVIAEYQAVGADADNVVLRERDGAVENLFIHEGPVGRFQVREDGAAVGVEDDLRVELRDAARGVFENDVVVFTPPDADEGAY